MRDARWIEVDASVASATKHFARAVELYEAGEFEGDDLPAYRNRMALLHAMESGYSSLEAALERVLAIIDEERPADSRSYHVDLVKRVRMALPGARPAIVTGSLADAIDEARRFRHVARKSYDDFDPKRAEPALAAAAVVRDEFAAAIDAFENAIGHEPLTRPAGG